MNFKLPDGTPLQWVVLIVAIALVSYAPLARIYLFMKDESWGGVPQAQNSLDDPGAAGGLESLEK
jgi:hypothetical protein